MRFLTILFISSSLIFLNGCIQTTALLGPGVTIVTTGNVLQAGLQYGANSVIEKETGKNTLEHLQDVVHKQDKDKKFKEKFTDLIEKKFQITRDNLNLN